MVKWMMIMQLLLVLMAVAANSEVMTCRPEERDVLLSFKRGFSISNESNTVGCVTAYAKTESWGEMKKKGNCCEWDGVTCDPQTGHVLELDLSCSLLTGNFPSNTTIFLLRRLRHLSLAYNSGLSGQVPREIGWLSRLTTLDLSFNQQLKMTDFYTIIANLTDLTKLSLTEVSIDSNLPPVIFNFTNLAYLELSGCGLEGEFPSTVNTSMLAGLTSIELSDNMVTGIIPGWIFTLPSLNFLSLSENLFTGIAPFKIGNGSSLTWFDADYNRLQGQIPHGIFDLYNLQHLNLKRNNLSGTIPLSRIHKLQSLNLLILSDNSLSIIDDMGADTTGSWPSFGVLSLSSCNLGHFPGFLSEQVNLEMLELSNNGIHGLVPDWLLEIGTLTILNISHNSLSGGLERLPWQSMQEMDIQYNLLQGAIPVPSPTTLYFWASNNQFTGGIPPSFCDIGALALLDLSRNNLTGNIPYCFASLISQRLLILDLRQNQLHGVIPSDLFENCPNLFTLSLSGNKLEGPIPQSLSNCLGLQLLDLSSNNFNDTFPYWLGVLPSLEVLILGSNNLQGSLMESNTTDSFPRLRMLDVSNNDLTGSVPGGLLTSMKAMVKVNNTQLWPYMGVSYYQDSITAWVKGIDRRLDAILDTLVLIDASRNRLEGPIPNAFGDLASLRWLNLAHNNFTGHIPPSLSKLALLESLDLSYNRLDGGIPNELVNLYALELFNVSENDLVGPVPTGKQFDTFSDASYLGNPGLCGPFLTNKCGKPDGAPNPTAAEGSSDESSGFHVWEIVLMGFGCGMLIGSVWGYLLFWEMTPYWVEKLILQIEQALAIVHQWRRQNKRK